MHVSYWLVDHLANVVRIQLRGAAGLGCAQTTRIPSGGAGRDIAGPSRVSCNAELDTAVAWPARPRLGWRTAKGQFVG